METDETGCLILEPEVANQLQGLKESSGFETMGEFLLHLFSLEEQSRTQQCLQGLFHHIEQPWLAAYHSDQELSTSIVPPLRCVSVGIQAELCSCKDSHNKITLPVEEIINQTAVHCQDDIQVEIQRNVLDSRPEESEFSSGDEDQPSIQGTLDEQPDQMPCTPDDQPDQMLSDTNATYEPPKFFTKKKREPYQEKVPVRTCEDCGATFTRKINYINHMRRHDAEEGPRPCQYCPSVFRNSFGRKIHVSIKHPEHAKPPREKPLLEPILCDICGLGMKSADTFSAHMRGHSDEQPYKCSLCPKTFKWSTSREYHERTHTKENPFMCLLCNKTFRFSSSMSRHQLTVHMGERPFKCPHCMKTFTASGSLKAHINTQHINPGARPYECPYCNKAYQKKYGMNFHIARKHPNPSQEEKAKHKEVKSTRSKKQRIFPHVSMTNVVSRGFKSKSDETKVVPLLVAPPNPEESDDVSVGDSTTMLNDTVSQCMSEGQSEQRQAELELAEVMAVMLSS